MEAFRYGFAGERANIEIMRSGAYRLGAMAGAVASPLGYFIAGAMAAFWWR